MFRFLHLSDIHVNRSFLSKEKTIQDTLKKSLLKAFKNAIDYAIEEELDMVCFVGDVFDHPFVSYEISKSILEGFNRLLESKIFVVYASGNHDPMGAIPELTNVFGHPYFILFDSDVVVKQTIKSESGQNIVLVGCGHKSKHEMRNLIKTFPRKSSDDLWIGFAHASVLSASSVNEKEKYMPASLSDVTDLSFDYFALGHIHIRQKLSDRVAYSGNIQGLNIKETGPRGGYLVELSENAIILEALNFSEVIFDQIILDQLEGIQHLYALEEYLIKEVSNRINEQPLASNRLLIRVCLQGASELFGILNEDIQLLALSNSIKEYIGVLDFQIDIRHLKPCLDEEHYSDDVTVLAEAIGFLKNLEEHGELLKLLMDLPIGDGSYKEQDKIEWIKQNTEKLTQELMNRMIKYDHY